MDSTFKNRLIVAFVWLCAIGGCVGSFYFIIGPTLSKRNKQQLLQRTSSDRHFQNEVFIGLDEFSGYCLWRSDVMREECARKGIKLTPVNISDYVDRLKRMDAGELQLAAFTVDSLIKTSEAIHDTPGAIIAPLDETKGADAILANKVTFPNIDALNDRDVRFVCVKDSPSETLVRVIKHNYRLPLMAENPFEFCNSIDDVYKQYQNTPPNAKKVFVLWEPYVSKIAQHPDYHVLVDSSKFEGYLFDALVAQRDYLMKKGDVLGDVVRSYYTVLFTQRESLPSIIQLDAKRMGQVITPEQAVKLADTIWFKNTQEAYAHFGLGQKNNIQHIEAVIDNIMEVLIKTKGISADPTSGHPNMLYYNGILQAMVNAQWHPGLEEIRQNKQLKNLTEADWLRLKPSGTLEVQKLVFRRGIADLSPNDQSTLDDLAQKLSQWSQYYLVIKATALTDADKEIANSSLDLAKQRADAVAKWLSSAGIDSSRVKSTAALGDTTTVEFVVGELPY